MNASDRRRVALASVFTLVALPALWVLNRESAATSRSPNVGSAGLDVVDAGGVPPTTAPYVPEPPIFVSGDDDPVAPAVIEVAVPPGPSANEHRGTASFRQYAGGGQVCTAMYAPSGATLTVVNVDNGQSTTCTNTMGMAIPADADIVLHTDVFAEISDLVDAPVPVRVSW